MRDTTREIIQGLFGRYPALTPCRADIETALSRLLTCFSAGGKLLLCGNGGSAADSQHIAGELMKGFLLPRPLPAGERLALEKAFPAGSAGLISALQSALPAISLVGETALCTACANDNGAALVFAQQVLGLGRPGDVLLCISTSGNSENVLYAACAARAWGLFVLGLTGQGGGALLPLCESCIRVPAQETYAIQEYHLPVYHCLCAAAENEFFGA